MAHWPESMFTYVPEEKLLFSMDVFGQHYATAERFDEEVPADVLMEEAKTYYANIFMPYGGGRRPVPGEARRSGRRGDRAQPRRDLAAGCGGILAAYRDWVACRPQAKVLVLYDTMWESTRQMAEAIAAGAAQPGVQTRLFHLRQTSLTQLAAEVLDAAAVAFGCSHAQSRPDARGRGRPELLRRPASAGQGGPGLRLLRLGTGRARGGSPGHPGAGWEVLREPIRASIGRPPRCSMNAARPANCWPERRSKAAAAGR